MRRIPLLVAVGCCLMPRPAAAEVTAEAVRLAIARGADFLRRQQRADGSWQDLASNFPGGVSALVMLALLESGTAPDDPVIESGLRNLRTIKPTGSSLESSPKTYVVALQTMVYCLAQPQRDLANIQANVAWLEQAQIKSGRAVGMWGYERGSSRGDDSNTQYALLGLRAAAELGVAVDPEVWRRSREHLTRTQLADGSWAYPGRGPSGSMTVAGISGLIISGLRVHEGKERIVDGRIEGCGQWEQSDPIVRALDWLARFKRQDFLTNPGHGLWTFYYLYGLERAGRLSGQRFIGQHDWYRAGAELLAGDPTSGPLAQRVGGVWQGNGLEQNELIATSFALLFLAKGRSPVIVNKLRHAAADPTQKDDWNNDRNDVRNLTEFVSRNWKRRMTWQVVDAREADVEDLLQAPVLFLNGHLAPAFSEVEKERLREYVEQGGFIFAEACCGREEFDRGIQNLFEQLFPSKPLKQLGADHKIWTADYVLPADGSLKGIDFG